MGGHGRAAGLLLGMALDAVFGDPRRGHPVAGFGRAAEALERRFWADSRTWGAVFAAAGTLSATGLGVAAQNLTRRAAPRTWIAEMTATALGTWVVVGGTSLRREAHLMAAQLERGELAAARSRLPHLCGRDPASLDAAGLARAAIESVAENTSDAVVAPLLWGAVAGLPGLLGYRAINTLDAMIGHRSPRHQRFGWATARLDDLANWVPARVTGLLTVAVAGVVGGSPVQAWRVLRRDGGRHPSPNAGRCEAAAAGALGVRLGGRNVYAGRIEYRPVLGSGRPPEVADIRRAAHLAGVVAWSAAGLTSWCATAASTRPERIGAEPTAVGWPG